MTITAPAARRSPGSSMSMTSRRRVFSSLKFFTIGIVLIVLLFPIAWMVLASFKSGLDITNPARTFSFSPTLRNYESVFAKQDFARFMVNSFIVAAATVLLSLFLGLPAAYVISRYRMYRATGLVFMARVIPAIALLVPWYYLFAKVGLVGTYTSLVLSHVFVGLPLVVAIMIGFFDGLPVELEEAGRVDGLTRYGSFARIAVPLAMPGIATSAILSFIFSWNNFMFALVLSGQGTKTLPVAIVNFIGYQGIDWGGLMAAAVVVTMPVIFVAFFTQRYIVSGLTAGATKG